MISAEFIVNVGAYQHVKVTIVEQDYLVLDKTLGEFPDAVKARLGEFHAELESWVKTAHEKALSGPVELVEAGLGASVVGVTEKPVGSQVEVGGIVFTKHSESPFPDHNSRPWERKLETQVKPWENSKPASLEDF